MCRRYLGYRPSHPKGIHNTSWIKVIRSRAFGTRVKKGRRRRRTPSRDNPTRLPGEVFFCYFYKILVSDLTPD